MADQKVREMEPVETQIVEIMPPDVENLIYVVRNKQVMVDSDLAMLYQVETGALNRAVKRNIARFPEDFRFQLTKDEYEEILTFNIFIKALGYGITKGDSRYRAGIKLIDSIKHIYDKLKSDEAFAFFEDIQKSEMEYLKEEYNLSDRNIEEIFNEYAEDFRDRSIVSYIYDNSEEAGREEAWQLGYVKDDDSISSKYFDYKKFGEDLVEDDEYFMELCDGRVVRLSY